MEILEWFFEKAAKKIHAKKDIKFESKRISTETELFSLKTIISFVLCGEFVPIQMGKGIGRVGKNGIILPEFIGILDSKDLNRDILLHKVLVASIIYRDQMKYSRSSMSYAERTVEVFNSQEKIIYELNQLFPQFLNFHQSVRKNLEENYSPRSVEEKEALDLIKTKNPQNYFRWKKFPLEFLSLWVELIDGREYSTSVVLRQKSENENHEKKTEKDGSSSTELPEEVSFKDKKQNPVFHSFEKLETVDEYSGGLRMNDAQDDLDAHSDALNELNIKHVIREEGDVGSIYKASISELFGLQFGVSPPRYPKFKFLPEWNHKSRSFQKDHCRLYLLDTPKNADKSTYKSELEKKYISEIQKWKNKLNLLFGQRMWVDRQLSGEEWNIDAFGKYITDIKSCGYGDNRLFLERSKSRRRFQVCILMDLSLSTESWVQNRKIFDIQLESVGLCGLMLEDFADTISVMGTWSETRHHCYLSTIKKQEESWDAYFQSILQLSPRGYTRLAPAIRFVTDSLQKSLTKNKLLILITDGKPTDIDHYEGKYGIEDMRHALLEAQQGGVFVQALAIDREAKAHFPQLFNPNKFRILSDPKMLPEQLFRIYYEFARQSI